MRNTGAESSPPQKTKLVMIKKSRQHASSMGNLSMAMKPMSVGGTSPPQNQLRKSNVFQNMINHSPSKSVAETPDTQKNNKFKRPPLPSIHLTSSKHQNSGQTFEFLKRKSKQVLIQKGGKRPSDSKSRVSAGDWKSLMEDQGLNNRQKTEKVQRIAK